MGALHDGHVALIRRAGKLADRVVVSAYVNPTQFTSREDYRQYPQRGAADVLRAKEAGADVLFRPKSLYAENASTWVEEIDRSRGRCGAKRAGHFRGVATVVMKLFGIVQPQVAVFGEKDKQQCEVIERMVRDLFCAVRIVQLPTIREKDGLPMSYRNLRLSPLERRVAGRWAVAVRQASQAGAGRSVAKLKFLLRGLPGLRLEYAEVVEGQLYGAARVGKVRLIDHRTCRGKS
jgi:pantoate--beta-alanine ligase